MMDSFVSTQERGPPRRVSAMPFHTNKKEVNQSNYSPPSNKMEESAPSPAGKSRTSRLSTAAGNSSSLLKTSGSGTKKPDRRTQSHTRDSSRKGRSNAPLDHGEEIVEANQFESSDCSSHSTAFHCNSTATRSSDGKRSRNDGANALEERDSYNHASSDPDYGENEVDSEEQSLHTLKRMKQDDCLSRRGHEAREWSTQNNVFTSVKQQFDGVVGAQVVPALTLSSEDQIRESSDIIGIQGFDTKIKSPELDLRVKLTTVEGQLELNPHLTIDQAKDAAKKEYNRRNAARARLRSKHHLTELQEKVAALQDRLEQITKENQHLKAELEVFRRSHGVRQSDASNLIRQGHPQEQRLASMDVQSSTLLDRSTSTGQANQISALLSQLLKESLLRGSSNNSSNNASNGAMTSQAAQYLLSQLVPPQAPSQFGGLSSSSSSSSIPSSLTQLLNLTSDSGIGTSRNQLAPFTSSAITDVSSASSQPAAAATTSTTATSVADLLQILASLQHQHPAQQPPTSQPVPVPSSNIDIGSLLSQMLTRSNSGTGTGNLSNPVIHQSKDQQQPQHGHGGSALPFDISQNANIGELLALLQGGSLGRP